MQPKQVIVRLASGGTLTLEKILLFPEDELSHASVLRMEGTRKTGGWSSGVGFIGPLTDVLAKSFVVGLVEQVVSDRLAREGINLLLRAEHELQLAKSHGQFFHISSIKNIAIPSPNLWIVSHGANQTAKSFVHDGAGFLIVEDEKKRNVSLFVNQFELWMPKH